MCSSYTSIAVHVLPRNLKLVVTLPSRLQSPRSVQNEGWRSANFITLSAWGRHFICRVPCVCRCQITCALYGQTKPKPLPRDLHTNVWLCLITQCARLSVQVPGNGRSRDLHTILWHCLPLLRRNISVQPLVMLCRVTCVCRCCGHDRTTSHHVLGMLYCFLVKEGTFGVAPLSLLRLWRRIVTRDSGGYHWGETMGRGSLPSVGTT